MGTAEQQRADVFERLERLRNDILHHRIIRQIVSAFDHGNKVRAGDCRYLRIRSKTADAELERAAFYTRLCCDNAKLFSAGRGKLLCARQEHADRLCLICGDNIGGVARYRSARGKDDLNIKALGKSYVLPRNGTHLLTRPSAVRHAPGVAEVYYIFIRQKLSESADSRQAAEAGIEHADWSVVHQIISPY